LLSQLKSAQTRLTDQHGRYVPVALKIAPDLEEEQIHTIADALRRHRIDGVIATNTTITRDAVQGLPHAEQTGGLSGAPVLELSNKVIRGLHRALANELPIIGAGGILSAADARSKIEAGADLVQLYTGLIYRGPALVSECAHAIALTR
jgi:dihydroorotate dehydrogenase